MERYSGKSGHLASAPGSTRQDRDPRPASTSDRCDGRDRSRAHSASRARLLAVLGAGLDVLPGQDLQLPAAAVLGRPGRHVRAGMAGAIVAAGGDGEVAAFHHPAVVAGNLLLRLEPNELHVPLAPDRLLEVAADRIRPAACTPRRRWRDGTRLSAASIDLTSSHCRSLNAPMNSSWSAPASKSAAAAAPPNPARSVSVDRNSGTCNLLVALRSHHPSARPRQHEPRRRSQGGTSRASRSLLTRP